MSGRRRPGCPLTPYPLRANIPRHFRARGPETYERPIPPDRVSQHAAGAQRTRGTANRWASYGDARNSAARTRTPPAGHPPRSSTRTRTYKPHAEVRATGFSQPSTLPRFGRNPKRRRSLASATRATQSFRGQLGMAVHSISELPRPACLHAAEPSTRGRKHRVRGRLTAPDSSISNMHRFLPVSMRIVNASARSKREEACPGSAGRIGRQPGAF